MSKSLFLAVLLLSTALLCCNNTENTIKNSSANEQRSKLNTIVDNSFSFSDSIKLDIIMKNKFIRCYQWDNSNNIGGGFYKEYVFQVNKINNEMNKGISITFMTTKARTPLFGDSKVKYTSYISEALKDIIQTFFYESIPSDFFSEKIEKNDFLSYNDKTKEFVISSDNEKFSEISAKIKPFGFYQFIIELEFLSSKE